MFSGILFGSIWYIFGDSLWLRSCGEHCDLEEGGGRRRKEAGRPGRLT